VTSCVMALVWPGHAAPARAPWAVDDETSALLVPGHYSHWPRSVAALEAVAFGLLRATVHDSS
jgi:hypothetical protein